jgi:hypothetical protein
LSSAGKFLPVILSSCAGSAGCFILPHVSGFQVVSNTSFTFPLSMGSAIM